MNAHTLARTLLYNIIKELHKSYKSVQIGKRRKEGRKEGRKERKTKQRGGYECSAAQYLKSVNKCTQKQKDTKQHI